MKEKINFPITVEKSMVNEAVQSAVKEILTRSYSNPLREAIEQALKDTVQWNVLIGDAIKDLTKDPEVKKEIVAQMLALFLKNKTNGIF